MKIIITLLLTVVIFPSFGQSNAHSITERHFRNRSEVPSLKLHKISEKKFIKLKQDVRPNRPTALEIFEKEDSSRKSRWWSKSPYLSVYSGLGLWVIRTRDGQLTFGTQDSITDANYIQLRNNERIVHPIPSPNGNYFVDFKTEASTINVFEVNSNKEPAIFRQECTLYHSNDFYIENVSWVSNNSFIIKEAKSKCKIVVKRAWQTKKPYNERVWTTKYRYYKATIKK